MFEKLSKLFSGNPLNSDDAAVRLEGIAQLAQTDTPAEERSKHAAQLIELASSDPDIAVRQAAIALVSDATALKPLLDDEAVAQQAAEALLNLDSRRSPDHAMLRHVIALRAAAGDEITAAIAAMPVAERIKAALAHPSVDARADIARSLRTAEALHELELASRDHDKTTNRIARERGEQLKTAGAAVAAGCAEIARMCESLKSHRGEAIDGHWLSKLNGLASDLARESQSLTESCSQLASFDADLTAATALLADANSLLAEVESVRTSYRMPRLIERLAGVETALASATPAGASQAVMLIAHWQDVSRHEQAAEPISKRVSELNRRSDELNAAFAALASVERLKPEDAELVFPLKETAKEYRPFWRQCRAAERQLDEMTRSIAALQWPSWAAEPAELTDAQMQMSYLQQAVSDAETETTRLSKKAEDALAAISAKLEQGKSDDVGSMLGNARTVISCLPKNRTGDLETHLGQVSARYDELTDWQDFATRPKREALVKAMLDLAEAPLEGDAQAKNVKALRADWLELGSIRKPEDRALLEQFDAAAEKAFEPSRAFFAEQKELRKRNAEARDALCVELETYLDGRDWPSTDLKEAQQRLRNSREAWNSLRPVDRKKEKAGSKRFEAAMDSLHKALKDCWQANIAEKEVIVTEAEALAQATDDNRSIDKIKALQNRWKAVGPTPRGEDQKLWKRLRAASDAVFNSRDSQRKAEKAERKTHIESAIGVIARLTEEIKDNPAMAVFNRYRDELNALPISPDDLPKKTLNAFQEAKDACNAAEKQAKAAKRLADLNAFRSEPDGDGDIEPFRRMAVEVELTAGIDSPGEDSDLRSRLHLEQLQRKLSGSEPIERDPKKVAKNWQSLGPVPAAAAGYQDRLFAALPALAAQPK